MSRKFQIVGVLSMLLGGAAHAGTLVYTTTLSGMAEQSPNDSMGTGDSTVTIDTVAMAMRVEAAFAGLTGTTTASHIHGPTPDPFDGTAGVITPVPTFPAFPLGVTSGSYDTTFDLTQATSFNPAFVAANGGSVSDSAAALLQAFAEGRAYLNIHTTMYGGGEIRGFYVPSAGVGVMCLLSGVAASRRRRA